MTRLDAIKNRTLSKTDQAKLVALAGMQEPVQDIGYVVPIPVINKPKESEQAKEQKPEPDTEYICSIVTEFYNVFKANGKTKKDAAALSLAACILKSTVVVGVMIKGKPHA